MSKVFVDRLRRGSLLSGLMAPDSVVRLLMRRPAGAFGVGVAAILLLLVILGPFIATHDPTSQDIANRLQGPSMEHLLGTDHLGRDLFSRLVFGTRVAMQVAIPTVLLAAAIGLLLGLAAGYAGTRIDAAMIIVMDTLQAFPGVVLALALVALLGPSISSLILVLGIAFIPGYARTTRALVLSTRTGQYVEAEKALGASGVRIAFSHILPNILAPIFILMAMDLPVAITAEAGLSFLGLGVQPPDASWGSILASGFARVRESPWGILSAGGFLMVATLGCTFLGETLRDIVDPRLVGAHKRQRP